MSDALAKHVEDDDRAPFDLNTLANRERTPGNPRVSTINESGLYSLIMGSKLPAARAFKKWVTSEVLPTIRKNGMYLTPDTAIKAVEDPVVFMARALVVAAWSRPTHATKQWRPIQRATNATG